MRHLIGNDPTAKPATVRIARRSDEQKIFDLLMMLHDENAMFPVSNARVMETIEICTQEKGGIMGVVEENGKLVGVVGLFIGQYWYTDSRHLEEYFNFVHPEHRKSSYAKDLLDFAKWVNENMGLILLMGILSTERTAAKCRLYERRLTNVGALFVNGLPMGAGPAVNAVLSRAPETPAMEHEYV